MLWKTNMDGTLKPINLRSTTHGTAVTVIGRLRLPPVGRSVRPRYVGVTHARVVSALPGC